MGVRSVVRARPVRLALYALAGAHVLEALLLRQRRRQLRGLPEPSTGPAATATAATGPAATATDVGVEVVAGAGITIDAATMAAVTQEMAGAGAGVVDLVPADLPATRALRLLRRVDPQRLGRDPLYSPGGTHVAVAVRRDVAERLAQRPDGAGQPRRPAKLRDLVRFTRLAQRYAPASATLRIAPGISAPAKHTAEDRWHELDEITAYSRGHDGALVLLAIETAHLATVTLGVLAAPLAGGVALASWCVQPLLVFAGGTGANGRTGQGGSARSGSGGSDRSGHGNGARSASGGGTAGSAGGAAGSAGSTAGTGDGVRSGSGGGGTNQAADLRPGDALRASIQRLPAAWRENLGALRVGRHHARQERKARPADATVALPADTELFEEPRSTCPWCDSDAETARLREVVQVGDQVGQDKPGTFRLTQCQACRHVFQNPALSLKGLDYYYDQAYEGAGEESSDLVFGSLGRIDEMRLRAIGQFTEPRSWLDVGTGFGHFPVVARQRWPEAVVDGLDIGESVEEAARRGWIDTAYRGLFPDLADGLPRSYEVVSMHHYLEHTRDPQRELIAAAKVLEPGGHLMIEVPDPDCFWSRRLGPFWLPWFQPQHQHFIPCENLVAALDSSGFEVVSVERGAANMVWLDLAAGAGLATRTLAGHADVPWRPAADAAHPARRVAVFAAATPVMAAAGLADLAWDFWLRYLAPHQPGNTYRVVARKV